MIALFGFGAGFCLPEISPFVTKTEVQLKMAGLAYRKERAMPPASGPQIRQKGLLIIRIQLAVA